MNTIDRTSSYKTIMKTTYREQLRKETEAFHEQTLKFMRKELNVKEYKGYSGGFGSYAQRGGELFMLRLRMNQGVMTKDKLKFIIDVCEQHGINRTHITTCQTIQLHDVSGLEVANIMAAALDHDIICRGGGGDFPRNVMCSPLSGVDREEHMDVRPYAKCCGDYILDQIDTYQLPRKLKIAFSSSDKNETHVNFRDLGFFANIDHTFDVYCAGGLGNNPRMGVLVGEHIDPNDCLIYIQAMIHVFMEHGNYENRGKARTRYMQETLGVEGLKEAFQKAVDKVMLHEDLKLHVMEINIQKQGCKEIEHPRAIPQKQTGLYAIYYHPIGGNVTPAKLAQIYEVIKEMPEVEVRITPQQGFYIINCDADEAQTVLSITDDGAQTMFETSVACVGSTTCQVGIRDSQGVLRNAIMYLREKHYADGVLPRIFISGCPSSCGTNQIGRIGFQGSVKVIDKKPYPAFQISVYGNETFEKTRFGEHVGSIREDDVCRFLERIADHVSAHQITYDQWIEQYDEEFKTILHEFIK